jgi:SAM-dependent methyltransferase
LPEEISAVIHRVSREVFLERKRFIECGAGNMKRAERERRFHNKLAASRFCDRRLVHRLSANLYDKEPIWGGIWDELGDTRGKIALDYGCGTGGFSISLHEKGLLVYGIDIAEQLVRIARHSVPAEFSDTMHFHVMDAHRLGFPNSCFDYVFGNGILHHLELEMAYAEIARVLKPGGKAFFMEPLALHPGLRIFRRLTPRARTEDESPLSFEDIDRARNSFNLVDHSEHYLFAVGAAPLNLIGEGVARPVIRMLCSFDQLVLKLLPAMRTYAWITVIRLVK